MLASRQPIVASVRRDAWVEVDLGAIECNIKTVRSWLQPKTKLLAVVKSDAYGHGAVEVGQLLAAAGADWLGVASVDEGCQLREAGIHQPILLLSPPPSWALATAIDADLQLTVTCNAHVHDIAQAAKRLHKIAKVHVKVDTGMHRLGVPPDKALELLQSVVGAQAHIKLSGLFSHLARADDPELTDRQNQIFSQVITTVRAHKELAGTSASASGLGLIHLASSDATRLFRQTHYDMVRPGLVLYGLEAQSVSDAVKPAMSVRGRINHLQEIAEGESVGYNLTWTAQRPSRIASIPIGYADGVDRRLSNRLQGLLLSQRVQQVGMISMDQMLFDITDVPSAQESDIITLIGCDSEHVNDGPGRHRHWLYLSDWAQQLDTITYELACRLRTRMPRIYTRHAVIGIPATETKS